MGDPDLDPERVGERGEPAAALQRGEPARHRDGAQDGRLGPVERRARERAAQHAEVEPRRVRDEHAAAQQPPSSGSTASGGGAPSTIACEIPVKRWMPRESGAETPTSEDQRSCSSPPPTSTAPTSVSSQRSRARPFVSVSTARNSAVASGACSRFSEASRTDMGAG